MFRDRYLLVQQRLLRHELFSPPLVQSHKRDYVRIATVDSLLGTSGKAPQAGTTRGSLCKESRWAIWQGSSACWA
jgi:hypothetical protein